MSIHVYNHKNNNNKFCLPYTHLCQKGKHARGCIPLPFDEGGFEAFEAFEAEGSKGGGRGGGEGGGGGCEGLKASGASKVRTRHRGEDEGGFEGLKVKDGGISRVFSEFRRMRSKNEIQKTTRFGGGGI